MKFRVNFNWKLALFVVIFLPILLRLGNWQLERADEKRNMLQEQQALVHGENIDIRHLGENQQKSYQNVSLFGEFSNKQFLLDNQIYNGKFGYELIQAFQLKQGDVVLVSRGWIAGSLDRRELPIVNTPTGELELRGYLYKPSESFQLEESAENAGWPKVVQSLKLEKMYKALGENGKVAHVFLVRLQQDDAALLTAHWQLINVQPEKHTAYAAQWFGMALLLVVMFIVASVKKTELSIE
jgi:surfeit locus 1 family protein